MSTEEVNELTDYWIAYTGVLLKLGADTETLQKGIAKVKEALE